MTIPPLLDATHAAFIQRGVAIALSSRDGANVPVAAHACGCRVSPDRRRVRIFVPVRAAQALLAAVRATSAVAAVFCEPATDRTIQLKGTDASVVPMTATDSARLPAYADAMVAQMALCGFSEAYARTAWDMSPDELVAVTFTPVAAFVQTPGPRAGAPLAR
jgi:hypothetical protein